MNEAEFRAAATAAFKCHQAGQLDAAETAYRNILDAQPDKPEILLLLGIVLGQANRLDEARTTLETATQLQPDNADAHYNLAECLFRLEDMAGAEKAYRAAIVAMPTHIEAAIGLSGLLLSTDAATEAVEITRAALGHIPDQPLLLAQLGAALLEAGDPAGALSPLETAIQHMPEDTQVNRNLAAALVQLEEFDAAIKRLRPLVNAEPRSIELLQLAAVALSASDQHERARPAAERILEIDPENIAAINLLGEIAVRTGDGDAALKYARRATEAVPDGAHEAARLADRLERLSFLDEAREWVKRARALAPDNALARLIEARLVRRSGDPASSLTLLDAIDTDAENAGLAANILFLRGQLLEALDRHAEAFAACEDAHAKRAITWQGRTRNSEAHAKTQDALLALFDTAGASEWIANWPTVDLTDGLATPGFLVGHPRSGTTLVERLLDAHNRVIATPELPMLQAMRNALDSVAPGGCVYPDALQHIGAPEIARLRTIYWDILQETHTEAVGDRYVIDKHPLNLDHLGLIARVFPGAKVLVALRDPRDVCISCFTTDFAQNNVTARYRNLPDIARAYAATMRLWLRYRDILPLAFHAYRYEDLARDPRDVLGAIVDFFELDWHESLLESSDSNVGRYINTPSYTGVTERVNTRAVGRWNGYAAQLEPVMPLLQPYIEAFGYDG